MFVSRGWMSHRQGLDVDRVSAGMVYEQVLNVAGALVVTAALFPFWHYQREVTAWALLAIPLIVVALHPRVFAPLAALPLRLLHRPPLAQVLLVSHGARAAGRVRGLWLVAGLAMWTFAAAVTNVTAAAFPEITAGFAMAFVAGMVVFFVPSGIGVREARAGGRHGGGVRRRRRCAGVGIAGQTVADCTGAGLRGHRRAGRSAAAAGARPRFRHGDGNSCAGGRRAPAAAGRRRRMTHRRTAP